ncbi:unnamed protein product [Schistosoma rodhaini]|uniref:Uncharacterized protein n=1 Tax=Schistosoma rodhaini TaxID=6188 RepID=A0AA85EK92_9TREM|nr:unnamed protein product [Schistosoma rodhaini]
MLITSKQLNQFILYLELYNVFVLHVRTLTVVVTTPPRIFERVRTHGLKFLELLNRDLLVLLTPYRRNFV